MYFWEQFALSMVPSDACSTEGKSGGWFSRWRCAALMQRMRSRHMFLEDFVKPKRRDAHCSLGERSALFLNNKG